MNQERMPFLVTSPGEVLEEELAARHWTQTDLAAIMKRPVQAINEIIRGTKQITPDTALELGAALGTSPEFWMNLESKYRLWLARKNGPASLIQRRSRLFSLVPVRELIKRGWIRHTESIDDLERQVVGFLGIASPAETPALNFRYSPKRAPSPGALLAWTKRVEQIALAQTVEAFSPDRLQEAIPKLLAYTRRLEDVAQSPSFLRNLGIRFAIVPHLEKTYLDGAAFWMDNSPVIALTLRYDRIDAFWFTLLHELAHIAAGHQGGYLDDLESPESDPCESEANRIAADWLVPEKAMRHVSKSDALTKAEIERSGERLGRHPGILIGQLHHRNALDFHRMRSYLAKVRPFLSEWIDTPGPA
ncbi:MAG: HigA family addiction module antidote protein [Armatimonadetes bacterium]|nr:HigA family addiction module antidote protein [Armatimonadota bacterium]